MKAMLVKVSLMTRVICNDDATDEEIIEKARYQLVEKVVNELDENVEEIEDDEECPYDPNHDNTLNNTCGMCGGDVSICDGC